ncbi:MAG: PHP domain-containing protein, partial [Flavobacteriales bacterium]
MFLNAHSWFSFKYGVMRPEALLEEAWKVGVRTLALTDIHSTAGVPDFVRDAERFGVRPVAGIEFRQGSRLLYIGIAKNNDGFQQLNELLSPHLLDGGILPEEPPEFSDAFFILPFSMPLRLLKPNERIGIKPTELTRLPFSPWAKRMRDLVALLPVTFRHQRDFNTHRLLRTMAKNTLISLLPAEELARPDECFCSEEEVRNSYRDYPQLVQNAERLLEECSIVFDSSDKTRKVFGTSVAADRERLHRDTLEGLRYRYPNATPQVIARMEHELDVIERMGFISYFLINQDIVRFARSKGFFHVGRGSGANSLVAYCLGITDVDPMELNLYFERFISTARKKPPDFDIDFSWKDRDEVYKYVFNKYNGEGAGTIHAAQIATYTTFQWRGAIRELGKAMGLPPVEIDALGEGVREHYRDQRRMPEGVKRELDKVAQAVVHYGHYLIGMPHQFGIHAGGIVITEKPVTHYTALHRPPKGFPVTQISMLECEDLGLHKFDILSQRGLGHIRDAVELVEARNGNEKRRMKNVECRTMPPRPVASCQLSVGSMEAVGAADICGGPPPSLFSALTTDNGQPRTAIDIHDIPRFKQDPAIKEILRTGDTIGCFYVESPAMRMLLKKLQVEDYLSLVAASSIIRPGVAESGMMREYLLRHNNPERVKQAPKELLDIMPETYGVMVYQEDVLKVAHLYAGLDLEEADILRRGMTARFRERPEFKLVEAKFFANCKAKNYPAGQAEEVWRQIESFASFSFAKGHSASYAVESYQSLYLKAHHPMEFLVGVANNFGGFYSTEFYLHEAKRKGAVIEAPCVNTSGELCTLAGPDGNVKCKMENVESRTAPLPAVSPLSPPSYSHFDRRASSAPPRLCGPLPPNHQSPVANHQPQIYLGLANIKSLTDETVRLILHDRQRNGPFADLPDLLHRVPLPLEQARILIRVGALRFTGRSKPQLLWDLALLHVGPVNASAMADLFITKVEEPMLPELHHFPLADAYDELDLLGFPLCDPFTLVEYGAGQGREGGKGGKERTPSLPPSLPIPPSLPLPPLPLLPLSPP